MALNLVQHRCEESIWDRQPAAEWDTERWLIAMMSGALLVASLKRRSLAGLALAIGGAGLAWWAARGIEERQVRRAKLTQAWPLRRASGDLVTESSEESFPASDAPAWTPTTGNMQSTGRKASMAFLLAYLKVPLTWPEIIKRTFRDAFYQDNVLGMTAQLAYCFFFALFPAQLFLA